MSSILPVGSVPTASRRYAFVTLLTSDEYLPGALVTAHSLREAQARGSDGSTSAAASPEANAFDVICLVTPHSVRVQTIKALCASGAFDKVLGVEPLTFEGLIHGALAHPSASTHTARETTPAARPPVPASQSTTQLALAEEGGQGQASNARTQSDAAETMLRRVKQNLQLLGRPDLGPKRGAPLTKLHAWRLTQYEKVVFLDADTLVLQSLSHLFDLPTEFAAAPDIGWPDAFNSGVLVLKPSQQTFSDIRAFAAVHGSWDGADQGLLNEYYGGERGRGENGAGGGWDRLSFKYNVTPNGGYTYAPAYRRFGSGVHVAHFIGEHKPWHRPRPSATARPNRSGPSGTTDRQIVTNDYETLVERWHDVFSRYYPLPAAVDRHSNAAYSVEVIHTSRGVEVIEKEIEGAVQPSGRFAVPTYEAVWNAHGQDSQESSRPGQVEDLRGFFAGGAALYGLSTGAESREDAASAQAGLGRYASFPLDGRGSLIPPEGLPADLLELLTREEREVEEQRRQEAAEEAKRANAATVAALSHPEERVPVHTPSDPPAHVDETSIARPWSPPKMAWDPAREPPPADGNSTTFEMPAHYDNAWDHRAPHSGSGQGWQPIDAESDARRVASRVPEHLMQGMYAHLNNQLPDASKVQAVFPWERQSTFGSISSRQQDKSRGVDRRKKIQAHAAEVLKREAEQRAAEIAATHRWQEQSYASLGDFDGKPMRRATRVFPDDPPRMPFSFRNPAAEEGWRSNAPVLNALSAEAEAASAESIAKSPPVVPSGLPPSLAYSNVWDQVNAIGEYADTVQAAQSPGPGGPPSLTGVAAESARVKAARGTRTRSRGRSQSRDRRRAEGGSKGQRSSSALGMDVGEYAGGSGSGEGEDSRDGDDESSGEDEADDDNAQGKNGNAAGSSGPGGYGSNGAEHHTNGDNTVVSGALGLTDDQFPEVLTVETPIRPEAGQGSGSTEQYGSVLEVLAASSSPTPRRRRAESRGYLRKAEATMKAQITASPRSPRQHGTRGGSWGGSSAGGGSNVESLQGGGASLGDFSQSPSGSSNGIGAVQGMGADMTSELSSSSTHLSGRARIRPVP
ncbi:glycogenin glucosyltransferase [Tilletia horrida]|nr:glycogenin glucosyltransferase [Tilletia horrida]